MSSFPVSSSRRSFWRDESPAITPGSPGPSRLSKHDVENYLSFATHLDRTEEYDLSWRLSHPPDAHRQQKVPIPVAAESERGMEDESELEDLDEEVGTENEGGNHQSSSPSKLRRVDGPGFAPSYQDVSGVLHKNKKRKRDDKDKERESIKWPLSTAELDKQSQQKGGIGIDSLEDTVKSFAMSYIRLNGLKSPYTDCKQSKGEGEESLSAQIFDPDLEQEIESNLPDDFIKSTKKYLNRMLMNLAVIRPADIGKKRRLMGTIDWMGVLSAASLDKDFEPLVKGANGRLRELYKVDDHDLLIHRLGILHRSEANPEESILDSLYDTVLPKTNHAIRPHQSQKELENRAEKRRLKEESRLAKLSTQSSSIPANPKPKRTKGKYTKRD
ncbi:hypothetical protein V865_005956 [Kwoniella europaea PYCC6329]|uniref:Rrn9 domain-containing protein n=1 Tax=Kwoniella europaea PYCC6329 TaxID=1423913 RepID=A0AAX4KNX7_9TREE